MIRLVIWRHGQTEWNAAGRTQGHSDIDLDDAGRAQAAEAAPRVAAYHPDVIVSSDLLRAAHTAEALAVLTGLPVEPDARLRERHFGPWQGLTNDEIRERYPDEYGRFGHVGPVANPAIETLDDMAKRVGAACRDAVERLEPGGTAVVVTHGGTARVACGSVLGWPPDVWHTLGALHNCHHAVLRRTDTRGWQLASHNVP